MKRKITNIALLFVLIVLPTALTRAQAPAVGDEAATPRLPNPQLEFVGQDAYEVNGTKGTRSKLSVTNRTKHPDFLWLPSKQLPPCGKNRNASRTWVEIFGSPGDKRLAGFCALRVSEDLGHLWFPVPSGEKGPACVYIVMTDRRTGKKYESNRVCSRSFTVVRGIRSAGGQQQAPGRGQGWIEIQGWDSAGEAEITSAEASRDKLKFYPLAHPVRLLDGRKGEAENNSEKASRDKPTPFHPLPSPVRLLDTKPNSGEPTDKIAKVAQPDLRIKQFLFPPTNDKALRVQVGNDGASASGASRLNITVRKINGTAVGRQTHVNIPALAPGKKVWLVIDAKSILPVNVSLKSTTFKLNADATGIVVESDETNNEVWHNL